MKSLYKLVVFYCMTAINLVHTLTWHNLHAKLAFSNCRHHILRRSLRDIAIGSVHHEESFLTLEQQMIEPEVKKEGSLKDFLAQWQYTSNVNGNVLGDSLIAHKFSDFSQICSSHLNALSEEGFNKPGIFLEFSDAINGFWKDGLNLQSIPYERSRIIAYLEAFYTYEIRDSKRSKGIRLKLYDILPKLLRIGLDWKDMHLTIQKLLNHDNFESISDGEEISSLLYVFGQIRNTKSSHAKYDGFDECLWQLVELAVRALESENNAFNKNQFLRMLHGLARSGLQWDVLPPQLQKYLTSNYMLIRIIRNRNNSGDVVPSLIQSLSVMKVSWSALHSSLQHAIVCALVEDVQLFSARELSNIVWALGKMHFTFKVEDNGSPSDMLKNVLLDKISCSCEITANAYRTGKESSSRDQFSAFDIESIFCGLGLMKVHLSSLTLNQRENILSSIFAVIYAQRARDRRIFFLHNCLWGLARMQATKDVVDSVRVAPETGAMKNDSSLSQLLLFSAVENLHAFLPEQLGDVMWALGTMKYSIADLGPHRADRMLAVLSRVFVHLPNRGGASTLWALGSMGFRWKRDFSRSCFSLPLPEGKLAQPLQKSLDKYLYQRVAAMHEQDYAVTLYSLGYLLGIERYGNATVSENRSTYTLRKAVWDKVDKRLDRLTAFFSSRSLSQALQGLSRTGIQWIDLSVQTRNAWEASLLSPANDSSARARGLAGMQRMQLAETIFSLGLMRCKWMNMSTTLQLEIRRCLERDFTVYKPISFTTMVKVQAPVVEFDIYSDEAAGGPIGTHETLLAYYAVEGLLRIEYPACDFPAALSDFSESQMKAAELQEPGLKNLSKEMKANLETFKRCVHYCSSFRAALQFNGSLIQ